MSFTESENGRTVLWLSVVMSGLSVTQSSLLWFCSSIWSQRKTRRGAEGWALARAGAQALGAAPEK